MELLEKRVKSRFSHRQLHIYPDYQFEEYVSLFRTLLQVPSHVCSDYKRWNKHIQVSIHTYIHTHIRTYVYTCICTLEYFTR